ncbi:MAG: hypothetical protein ACNY01_12365 [Desulfobacteria bacterium]
MGKYKVQVQVELIECNDDAKDHDLRQEKNGSFTMTISEQDAIALIRNGDEITSQIGA